MIYQPPNSPTFILRMFYDIRFKMTFEFEHSLGVSQLLEVIPRVTTSECVRPGIKVKFVFYAALVLFCVNFNFEASVSKQ